MFDKASVTRTLPSLMECCRALIDAIANNRTEEVYRLATPLCMFDGAGKSILLASPVRRSDGTTAIGAFFKPPSKAELPAPKRARLFDIVHFARMRLMDAACAPNTGQGFFFQEYRDKRDRGTGVAGILKYYLRFGDGKRGAGSRVYVTRLIADAGAGEVARFAEEHYSYCVADLIKAIPRKSGLPPGKLGRVHATKLACEIFAGGRLLPEGREGITLLEYEAVLADLTKYADAFHTGAE